MSFFTLTVSGFSTALVCQAGGVLDPNAQLKLSDFTGKGGCDKLASAMGALGGNQPAKATNKRRSQAQQGDAAREARYGFFNLTVEFINVCMYMYI